MAARAKSRQYPTAYKLKAIKRAEGGEGVLPVARKLGISRKLLHDRIKAWKAHGPEGLNRKRGPKPGPRRLKPVGADDKKTLCARPGWRQDGAYRCQHRPRLGPSSAVYLSMRFGHLAAQVPMALGRRLH